MVKPGISNRDYYTARAFLPPVNDSKSSNLKLSFKLNLEKRALVYIKKWSVKF